MFIETAVIASTARLLQPLVADLWAAAGSVDTDLSF
jgi:hypothetical protein